MTERWHTEGPGFQRERGRYKSTILDSESYTLVCHRYVESNPVRASWFHSRKGAEKVLGGLFSGDNVEQQIHESGLGDDIASADPLHLSFSHHRQSLPLNGRSCLAIPGMLLTSPIRSLYASS
jgi:hypothetical protein